MAITSEPTFDQALALARRLSPQNRAALIAQLARELVVPVQPRSFMTKAEGWSRWSTLREEIGREYPNAQLGKRLEDDRRERDVALGGIDETSNVHP